MYAYKYPGLKGQCHEIFDFRFPQRPFVSHKGHFKFFWKYVEKFAAQGAPPCQRQMKKIFYQKSCVAPWFENISANFAKNFETTLMLFSWAWEKIWKKSEAKNLVILSLWKCTQCTWSMRMSFCCNVLNISFKKWHIYRISVADVL